jgi:signal transduction histidine kinase
VSDESKRLQEELHQAREELRRRESFVAVIAHELRNPITPVLISIDSLIQQLSDGEIDQHTLLRRLQTTRRYVNSMRGHLDRLLEFSRARSGRLELAPEETDLSLLVGSVLDEMTPMIQAAKCELTTSFTMPLIGYWDQTRLTQVIWNLVSNAVKYAAAAPIEVTTMKAETTAILSVKDHGPGIPEKDREAVFRSFERTTTARHHTGFGVGLWLVRRIVEAMDGTLELASEVGKGSTFSVTLPRSTR